VADVTGGNPNVMNEIGQAQILGKPLVFISQDSPEDAPFNVRGLVIHRYSLDDILQLKKILYSAIVEATSPNEILRSMLIPSSLGRPTKESRFAIVASPLSYRRATRRRGGYGELRRTSSDYVGVRGILQSFGHLYGFDTLPDIIDPDDFDDDVIAKPMNMYIISSPKANRWTSIMLGQFHKRWVPRLEFRADSESPDITNIWVSLYSDNRILHPPGWKLNIDRDRYARDFGFIIRAPNPYHENHMIAIMAGRSSLGTEAACRAFTDTVKLAEIRQRLAAIDVDLENHKQAFWLLVSMQRFLGDSREEANPESLRLHQLETFQSPV
jgi:hypothetical protein